jgi:hypothetical protein
VEDRQMKAKALKVVQRLRSRALVGCFELWRASVVEEKERQGLEKGLRKVHVLAHELKVQVGFIEGLVSSCPSLWQKLDAEMRLHDESPRRLQILRDYLFEIGATAYVVGEKELDREEMLEKVVSRRRVSRHLADVRGLNAGSALTPAPQQGQASMCGKILGTSSSSQKSQQNQMPYYSYLLDTVTVYSLLRQISRHVIIVTILHGTYHCLHPTGVYVYGCMYVCNIRIYVCMYVYT